MTTKANREDPLQMPRTHTLERQQRIELPIEDVFAFYGDARSSGSRRLGWVSR